MLVEKKIETNRPGWQDGQLKKSTQIPKFQSDITDTAQISFAVPTI